MKFYFISVCHQPFYVRHGDSSLQFGLESHLSCTLSDLIFFLLISCGTSTLRKCQQTECHSLIRNLTHLVLAAHIPKAF